MPTVNFSHCGQQDKGGRMILVFCLAPFLICFVVTIFQFCDYFDVYKKRSTLLNAKDIDALVDSIINKAVIIAEYITERKNISQIEFENKKMEQACSIVADVMLQHGIKPRDYNLPALVIVAKHKNHFISLYPTKDGDNKHG
jgi:hypothetical protein